MPPSDYIAIKQRLLLAADVADLLIRTPDKVRFDEETYPLVADALSRNRADVQALLVELDILRAGNGASLFPEMEVIDASPVQADDRRTVDSVPPPEDQGRSGEVRPDHAATGGGLQGGGPDGERAKRSKPRRNRKANARVPAGVEPGAAAEPVGGGEG